MRLAERVSGEQLDELFRVWLFTAGRPALEGAAAAAQATATRSSSGVELERLRR